ncbi:MAG: DUF63 family protein [Euryarchaeota archaeon]|nr:DUF63 family protein [Euryarchaeota archaeon]
MHQYLGILDFIKKYYIDPIRYGTGYNVVNTLTYAIILIVVVALLFKLMERLKITINKKFIFAFFPFMILGGTTRALVDGEVLPHTALLITPGIYLTIAILALIALVLGVFLREKYDMNTIIFIFGGIFAAISVGLVILNTEMIEPFLIVLGLFLAIMIPTYLFTRKFDTFLDGNIYLIAAHVFDASTTFTGIHFYNYWEQHVLPSFLIDLTGAWIMFPIKILIVILALYIADDIEDKDAKNFLKLVIFVLGMAPGTRNLSRMIMGV